MRSPATLRRLLDNLPCSVCGEGGPHLFRVQREHGYEAICRDCRPVLHFGFSEPRQAAHHEAEGRGYMMEFAHGCTMPCASRDR